jgi:multiple sugar transport system substrate-binding protein
MALAICLAVVGGAFAANEDETGEIVFWSWSESETKGLAERFNKAYPNITIKFVPVDSSSFVTKFQTALITKSELPDVCLQEVDTRGSLFALDCWENLEAAPYNFDRGVVYPQIIPTMVNDKNQVIGIERELNPSGMIYKRALTEKYLGTQDPDEVGALVSDWDKLIALGEKVAKDSGGKVKLFAGLNDLARIALTQYSDTIFAGETANVSKYFEYLFGLLIRANKAGMVGKSLTYSPEWNATFLDETTIFYYAAPWTAQWVLKPNDPDGAGRWGMTTAPVRGYSVGGTAYGIPSTAKRKDLAWKFIEWATTTDDGTDACEKVVGAIVSRQANYAKGFPKDFDPYFAGQAPNAYLMEKSAPTMKIRQINQYDVVLADVTNLVMEMIGNDSNLTLGKAVSTAVTEMKNKLPAEVKVN